MAKDAGRWTLEDLVDFECGIGAAANSPPALREVVLAAVRGLDGAAARRVGLRVWLDRQPPAAGARFHSALSMCGSGLAVLAVFAGISGVIGMVNPQVHGLHLVMFLALLIGGQWLVLALAALAWAVRRRSARAFSGAQAIIAAIVRKFAGNRDNPWWERVMKDGGPARSALLWRIARLAQATGVWFNIGILCGLCGLFFTKDLRFYWESTTESAMAESLRALTHWLSLPWGTWLPTAVPDAAAIEHARWHPGGALPATGPVWWHFALMTTACWGMLPRMILWWVAAKSGRLALEQLDFQARSHRVLWRELTGPGRVETDEKPLDGVLVLDVGGSGITPGLLRGFLLRHLRVNPTSWHPVAVMDPGAEAQATRALAMAPAGVVLLAEGWALSPARMHALHHRIRSQGGGQLPIKFVIANTTDPHTPAPPTADERREWERWVDSLKDPMAEVYFYQSDQAGG
jgi:Protein of unknown function (DUF2868)